MATNGALNGNGSSALNGHGHGSDAGSSSGSGSSERSLLLIHSESNTRLAITGIPETLYGLASDLRDEFFEGLRESGKYTQLIPEAQDNDDEEEEGAVKQVNNTPLLLASYWLQFLAPQHHAAKPILGASKNFFAKQFLVNNTIDIHSIASKLDVDERKAVIGGWVSVCAKLGQEDFGPKGKIWQGDSSINLYAVFGGQGSNEYYWDEMEVRRNCHLTFISTTRTDIHHS